MFGTVNYGANAYSKVGMETGVASASPHQLIVMLFEGAITAIASAASMMASGDVAGKGQAISKAITIIDSGLRASLDKNAGGDIAQNLDALYEYMGMRLLLANAKNDAAMLQEVQGLLQELKGAWVVIGGTPQAQGAEKQQDMAVPAKPAVSKFEYDPLAPRASNMVRA